MGWKKTAIACAVLACVQPIVAAQQSVDYGTVSGRVMDIQGAVIPGAQITARQTETNVTTETASDEAGRFRFHHLKVGPYELKIHIEGFTDLTRSVNVNAGSAFDLPLTLTVGGISTTIDIVDGPPLIDTARSQIAGILISGGPPDPS